MKKIVSVLIFLLWTSFSVAQIKYFKKPIQDKDLPSAFIAMDTATYRGIYEGQRLSSELINKLDSVNLVLKERIRILELQKNLAMAKEKAYQEKEVSFKRELGLLQEDIKKERKQAKFWRIASKIVLPVGLGGGIYLGTKFF